MKTEYDLKPERDVGLYVWLKEATEGLGREDARRVTEETTEHFILALEELRREGLPEPAARVEAVARLGDASKANIDLIRSHFRRTNHELLGERWTRLLYGPLNTLVLGLVTWRFYVSGEPSNPTPAYVAMAVSFVSAWVSTIAAHRGSYVGPLGGQVSF